jgi:aryl-phospho-beta-D-glucosidase BglC (GH1 family)
LSSESKQNIRNFIQAQMVGYEKADGWIFWTWKTESAPEWDFQALSAAGVIPNLANLGKSSLLLHLISVTDGYLDASICGGW